MAYDTVIQQGRFTSTGVAKTLQIRSDFDWIRVYNETNLYAAGGATSGAEFYFQRGMTNGRGVLYVKENTIGAVVPSQLAANAGFTLLNTSDPAQQLTASVPITNTTNVVRPIISTADTSGLISGSIVRLYNMSSGNAVNGLDFAVDTIVANTSFRMAGAFANTPFANGAATGQYRIVNFDPEYYPPYRYIINITAAASAVVTLSVPSQYKVGQEVVFRIPVGFGMTEMDGLTGTVTAVTDTVATQTITVNIDSSAFTAFTFPTNNAAGRRERCIVAPVGANTGYIITQNGNILNDAVRNTGFIGVRLNANAAAAPSAPCGENGDVMYWIAGKSFSVTNE